jgi:hypothetical protein
LLSVGFLSFLLMIIAMKTTSLVTTIRYSMTTEGPKYLATTAVFWMELIKLFTAVLVTLYQSASG